MGITRRLNHVAQLGVDCVWLSPICKSPQACYTRNVYASLR
ncbi:alpha-amylase family glycosyl hydrolase [Planktomarina sp.]|nr:alpha-amylase family glycosyl hydrolase [Planktomarina sp.]MDB4841609.1 alpha-amylase family glycosyl hydrolase [Planktomarina sp.]